MNIDYKELTMKEAKDHISIRLELLKNNPINFGSSYEQESQFTMEKWESRFTNPNAKSFGAFDGNDLIGVCVVITNPRTKMKHKAALNSMYIKPDYRGKGVSKNILDMAFKYVIEKNVEILNLSVVSSNDRAIKLYENLGFIKEGMEKKAIKYEGEYHDLVLMQKYFL